MEETKIAELREQSSALCAMLKELGDAELQAFRAWVQTLTTTPVYVRSSNYDWGFEVSMLDPEKGYGKFATDVDVRWDYDYFEKTSKLTFNTGSSGSFGTDNEGQVFKYKMMATLLDHAEELEAMAKAFSAKYQPLREKHWEIRRQIEKWESDKKQAEEDAKRAEVLATVAPGAWFVNPDETLAYLVVKKTAKMVFYKWYSLRSSWCEPEKKDWVNMDGWKNETNAHDAFANLLIRDGFQLGERPEGVNP